MDVHDAPKEIYNSLNQEEGFYRLDASRLRFIPVICDLCGEDRGDLLMEVKFLGHPFRFVRCAGCGLIYQNPMLDVESRFYLYHTLEYWSGRQRECRDEPMLNYHDYLGETEERRKNLAIRLAWVRQRVSPGGRVLDLGCADGLFVKMLQDAGYDAVGLDISAPLVAWGGRTHGVDLRVGDFGGIWPVDGPFAAITCFATVSNIIHPSKVFANVRRTILPNGVFIFNYGDYDRLLCRLLGDRLYLYRPSAAIIYSSRTIARYCTQAGMYMTERWTDTQHIPLARLLGFLRLSWIQNHLESVGLEGFHFKAPLPTGFAACARLSQE